MQLVMLWLVMGLALGLAWACMALGQPGWLALGIYVAVVDLLALAALVAGAAGRLAAWPGVSDPGPAAAPVPQ